MKNIRLTNRVKTKREILVFISVFVFLFCINYSVSGQNSDPVQNKEAIYNTETKEETTANNKVVEEAVVKKATNCMPLLPSKVELQSKNLEELQVLAIVRFNKQCMNKGIYLTEQQSIDKQIEVDQMSKDKLITEILKDGKETVK